MKAINYNHYKPLYIYSKKNKFWLKIRLIFKS